MKSVPEYVIDNPNLMQEWDWELNATNHIEPDKISSGSQKTAAWVCSKHNIKYCQIIRAKTRGQNGCPFCKEEYRNSLSRSRYIQGKPVLAETHPELLVEWLGCDNPKYTPYTCLSGSKILANWKCKKCGGEYRSYISNRALHGAGCPYCAGQKVLSGYNDLQTINPVLAQEWSSSNTLCPNQVTPKSNKKVYWTCRLGHEDYLMSIKQRSNGQGCPTCAVQSHTSFPEQAIYFYVKQAFTDALNRYKYDKYEIDIFIPSKNIGIEYNGSFYHKKKGSTDVQKKTYLTSHGITLLTVKEYQTIDDQFGADYYIDDRVPLNHLSLLIINILSDIGCQNIIDVNCSRDSLLIREQYITSINMNSIAQADPRFIQEWDYEKNGKILPEFVSRGSNQKCYWKCPSCGYSYLSSPKSRIRGRGCPVCCNTGSQIVVVSGINNFRSQYPALLDEWDYESNNVDPSNIYGGGDRIINWKCKKGHLYSATLRNRIKGQGCPYCAGKRILPGFNDLLSQNPEIASEWDYELNECTPNQIHYNNQSKIVHWVCNKCGYKWESTVHQRLRCPNCTRRSKQINVYNASDLSFYSTFEDAHSLCEHFNLKYKNQHGNIASVCNRKQKTLLGKYILRHANDDEFEH